MAKDIPLNKILKKIADVDDLVFIEDLCIELNVSKTWFYERFPVGSNEMDEVKDALSANSADIKRRMRRKWQNSDSAPLQIGLMKLLGTQDERDALNNNVTIKAPEKEKTEFEIRTGLYDD